MAFRHHDVIGRIDNAIVVSIGTSNMRQQAVTAAPGRVIGVVDDAIGIEVAGDGRMLQYPHVVEPT